MEYYGCGLPWGKHTIEWEGVVSDIFVAVCPSILVHFSRKTHNIQMELLFQKII